MGGSSVRWRKSSFSGGNGGGCVEVADHDGMIMVRDTKDHGNGPVHRYTRAEWDAFIAGVRNGEFDLDASGRLP
jgi:predicted secreted Zn-dependent protease